MFALVSLDFRLLSMKRCRMCGQSATHLLCAGLEDDDGSDEEDSDSNAWYCATCSVVSGMTSTPRDDVISKAHEIIRTSLPLPSMSSPPSLNSLRTSPSSSSSAIASRSPSILTSSLTSPSADVASEQGEGPLPHSQPARSRCRSCHQIASPSPDDSFGQSRCHPSRHLSISPFSCRRRAAKAEDDIDERHLPPANWPSRRASRVRHPDMNSGMSRRSAPLLPRKTRHSTPGSSSTRRQSYRFPFSGRRSLRRSPMSVAQPTSSPNPAKEASLDRQQSSPVLACGPPSSSADEPLGSCSSSPLTRASLPRRKLHSCGPSCVTECNPCQTSGQSSCDWSNAEPTCRVLTSAGGRKDPNSRRSSLSVLTLPCKEDVSTPLPSRCGASPSGFKKGSTALQARTPLASIENRLQTPSSARSYKQRNSVTPHVEDEFPAGKCSPGNQLTLRPAVQQCRRSTSTPRRQSTSKTCLLSSVSSPGEVAVWSGAIHSHVPGSSLPSQSQSSLEDHRPSWNAGYGSSPLRDVSNSHSYGCVMSPTSPTFNKSLNEQPVDLQSLPSCSEGQAPCPDLGTGPRGGDGEHNPACGKSRKHASKKPGTAQVRKNNYAVRPYRFLPRRAAKPATRNFANRLAQKQHARTPLPRAQSSPAEASALGRKAKVSSLSETSPAKPDPSGRSYPLKPGAPSIEFKRFPVVRLVRIRL